ncbi:DDE-type integrase/transposase/recombinase, partial [Mycetocola reblochoni]
VTHPESRVNHEPYGRHALVNRRFVADGPRKLWVCDVTYVATWSGFAYVAFVTDVYSRRIVGWNVAATLKSEVLPMQALDMAAWQSGGRLDGLIHHADHGSNYTAMVYTDRIAELGAVPSTGTVGDSFDCQSVSARSRNDGVVLAGVF